MKPVFVCDLPDLRVTHKRREVFQSYSLKGGFLGYTAHYQGEAACLCEMKDIIDEIVFTVHDAVDTIHLTKVR